MLSETFITICMTQRRAQTRMSRRKPIKCTMYVTESVSSNRSYKIDIGYRDRNGGPYFQENLLHRAKVQGSRSGGRYSTVNPDGGVCSHSIIGGEKLQASGSSFRQLNRAVGKATELRI